MADDADDFEAELAKLPELARQALIDTRNAARMSLDWLERAGLGATATDVAALARLALERQALLERREQQIRHEQEDRQREEDLQKQPDDLQRRLLSTDGQVLGLDDHDYNKV